MFRRCTLLCDLRKGWIERMLCLAGAGMLLLPMTGCARSNELNLFGAYFPVWLLALLVGAVVAFACRFLFVRLRIEAYLGPLTLVYICITVSVSCIVWLLFV